VLRKPRCDRRRRHTQRRERAGPLHGEGTGDHAAPGGALRRLSAQQPGQHRAGEGIARAGRIGRLDG
jgi:hypothetical protein